MAWISKYQTILTESEAMNNAQMVANHFSDWSPESISALCGNMWVESWINPDMYELGKEWSGDWGYGLVQWTPRSKYWDWAVGRNLPPRNGDSQLARLDYEIDNNIQWITISPYMSFADFRSNKGDWSVEFLTEAFTWCYERPRQVAGQESMAERKRFAKRVASEIDFKGGSPGGGGDGTGRQLAVMPIDYIYITQGEWGEFNTIGTHRAGSGQELAIDFIFPMNQYPLFAPFDIEVMRRIDAYATVVWKNTRPVRGVDGNDYDELHIIVIHDDNWRDYNPGDTRKKGEHFGNSGNATGTGGISTGDHFHFEVMRGHTYEFPPQRSNQLSIYDIFDTTGVEIAQGRGYDWKTSDFVDEDEGGGGGDIGDTDSSKNNDVIAMLLCGAMKGW